MTTHQVEQAALALLSRRDYSFYELSEKLKQKGFRPDEVAQVLDSLVKSHLQSDYRFAEMIVKVRSENGYGPVRIQNELKKKRISDSIIHQVLFESDCDWLELLQRAYQKKYRGKKPVNYAEKVKQIRFLQYRGFTVEQIESVVSISDEGMTL